MGSGKKAPTNPQYSLSKDSCPLQLITLFQTFLHHANFNPLQIQVPPPLNLPQAVPHPFMAGPAQPSHVNNARIREQNNNAGSHRIIQQHFIMPTNVGPDFGANQGYHAVPNGLLMRETLVGLYQSSNHHKRPDLSVNQVSEPLEIEEDDTPVLSYSARTYKNYRCDSRGKYVSNESMRLIIKKMQIRRDIGVFGPAFVAIYESLIPSSEETAKQSELINSLSKLICTEWPHAKLHRYGSSANSFGLSNCDIDLCLSIDTYLNKREIITKLAEIIEDANLQITLALPQARVPIVKMKDPKTGLSCNICINNLLAIVNTKLLKDYAQIDPRLRQLAIIVKHWAKSRRINETFQGTLSSYAYVVMCIHYLQTRQPSILPCLQEMEQTYVTTVDNKEYGYYDQVEKLGRPGTRNRDSIARLVWGFFHYWAYQHDYASDVISIRTGSVISKHEKGWTKRMLGYDQHFICIEDPFDTTHDLGRIVDKSTIYTLREEFERAATLMQFNSNPTEVLFEKYVPPPKVDDFGGLFEVLNM